MDIARKDPDIYNVSLTNFFFFRDEEEKYGPKVAHISLMEFFDVSALRVCTLCRLSTSNFHFSINIK